MALNEEKIRKRMRYLINVFIEMQKQIDKMIELASEEEPIDKKDLPKVIEIGIEEIEASELSSEMKEMFKVFMPTMIARETKYIV